MLHMDDKAYVVRYWNEDTEEYRNFDYGYLKPATDHYQIILKSKVCNPSLFIWDYDTESVEEVLKGEYPQDLI